MDGSGCSAAGSGSGAQRRTKTCGCRNSPVKVGARFGRLVVLERRSSRAVCQCDCGKLHTTSAASIRQGAQSCGCLARELLSERQKTHGMTGTPSYGSWRSMLDRCRDSSISHYGARGVTVCDRWDPAKGGSFENFYADMGERPEGKSLDKDIKGGVGCLLYSPGNCCWATLEDQRRQAHSPLQIRKAANLVQMGPANFCKVRRSDFPELYGLPLGEPSSLGIVGGGCPPPPFWEKTASTASSPTLAACDFSSLALSRMALCVSRS
jgi:hypothetical protein